MVFLSLCLSRLWELSPPWCPQNAVIIPREEQALKGRRCVSLCSFLGLCPRASEVRSNFQWHSRPVRAPVRLRGPPADASPLLSPIEGRRHNGVKRWERNSSGNGRKSGADTERDEGEGVEENHEVIGGTFTSAGFLTPLSPLSHSLSCLVPLSLSLSLSLSAARSPSCRLCLFIISHSQRPFPPHSPGSLNKRRRAVV